jgi:undecaprenyl-phosphate 4-deoxy-4-formamido-L-arabinose transferase
VTPAVSVVVPVYGNASTLRELASRIAAALSDYELIFVNDASPDDSADVLATLDARVITHPVNRGQNGAVLTGFANADGATIVVLDGDLQDPPETIPELLRKKAESGAAVAFASRTGNYQSAGRMVTSSLYKSILSQLTSLPEGAGLFVAMDREIAKQLVTMAPLPSIVAALGLLRVKKIAVPVVRATRDGSAYSGFARMRLAFRTLMWVLAHR